MNKGEATRLLILEAAFDLMYEVGYNAMSFDKVQEQMENKTAKKLTKGTLYHHFKNKEALGLAVINEIIYPRFKKALIDPLDHSPQGIDSIYQTIRNFMLNISEEQLRNGCPSNNLIQEMVPSHSNFREALSRIIITWKAKIITVLSQAANQGQIKPHNFEETAQFIIASYEGARGLGKLYQTYAYYHAYLKQLKNYLDTL